MVKTKPANIVAITVQSFLDTLDIEGRQYTSSEHVFPLQQLDDGCLRGRYNNDAPIFAATNKSSMFWYVHTCCYFKRFIAIGDHTQLIYNSSWIRVELIECFLQTNRSCDFQPCRGLVLYKRKTLSMLKKNFTY